MKNQIIDGLGEIIDSYDALIVDLWGVTHNGRELFVEAVKAFELAKSKGLEILFLSNAPRRSDGVHAQLKRLGLSPALYDGVVTSGDAAWEWIQSHEAQQSLGERCFHLCDESKDTNMRQGLGVQFVKNVEQATFILNTGPQEKTQTLDLFEPLLKTALRRKLPMLCANPDLSVLRGAVEELCAGAIAAEYETRGGNVIWFGKPWPQVYHRCHLTLKSISSNRILCIGDSMRTDIKGANNAGLDCLLVATGLRRQDLLMANGVSIQSSGLEKLCVEYGTRPTYVCVALKP